MGFRWLSVYSVSIIMLQKVAAMVDKIAADLGLIASKVRLLLHKKFFILAASSAAIFCVPLYIIVMPYLRHFGSFVPKNRLRLIVVYLNLFLYLCSRFTSKVWNKAD